MPFDNTQFTLMEAISGSQKGTQAYVANSSVASYLAGGEWRVVSGTPKPTPTPVPVPAPTPTVYDQLYFRQSFGQVKGIGQIARISLSQVSEALSKGWVKAVGLVNVSGYPIVDTSTPLSFYAIWPVGTPLPG